jgi:hypothetical protein
VDAEEEAGVRAGSVRGEEIVKQKLYSTDSSLVCLSVVGMARAMMSFRQRADNYSRTTGETEGRAERERPSLALVTLPQDSIQNQSLLSSLTEAPQPISNSLIWGSLGRCCCWSSCWSAASHHQLRLDSLCSCRLEEQRSRKRRRSRHDFQELCNLLEH